ncbi:ATP-dependent nuclease [Geomonas oryzae]|nr:ATP-binding protein [Geomonas oryzae]
MKLEKLKIVNFKRIERVEFELADINILVGTNGCGKSSIIQAIHLGCCVLRQADRVERGSTSTVGIEELDYLPTDSYKRLGHNTEWGNKVGTPSSSIELGFKRTADNVNFSALCELRSARNAGISITGSVPLELVDILRRKRKFFSAYIPGISGIPNKEEKKAKKVILKACSYGDSNIILRNVLLLLKDRLDLLERWISNIIGPIRIIVEYDEERHLIVACKIEINGSARPIELIGTGYLQLIQIFSYILLFDPGILLIDEPDIHLHPTMQEKLVQVLAVVASERNTKILLTTHSPFIVRGAPVDSKVYWVKDGRIESDNRTEVELALGWGCFGKKILIISEDTKLGLLKKIISQWPEIDKFVTFYPGTGYKHIATPTQAAEISAALGNKFKVVVHRDRDSLTDVEVDNLSVSYNEKGVTLWFPDLSDVESYFCQAEFIQSFLGCSAADANEKITNILTRHAQPIREQFNKQRSAHNEELYKAGGSPTNEDVWETFQNRHLKGAKGKYVFNQLKNEIPGNVFKEDAILRSTLDGNIAVGLKAKLEHLLN